MNRNIFLFSLIFFLFSCFREDVPRRGEFLFFGEDSEEISTYANWMAIEIFKMGINLTYTINPQELEINNLRKYDGLVVYNDGYELTLEEEHGIEKYVNQGHGLIIMNKGGSSFTHSFLSGLKITEIPKTSESPVLVKIEDRNDDFFQESNVDDFGVDENYSVSGLSDDIELVAHLDNREKTPQVWIEKYGKGSILYSVLGGIESTWKDINFLRIIRYGAWAVLNDKAKNLIGALDIPNVDIYGDTIFDFTARHNVPDIQEPLIPEEARKLMEVPVDFEFELFASEPDIINPIAMNWDERGRLWVIETFDYPNSFVENTGQANDRIKICEDTDGDGVADKFTVFADGLNIATSLTFANGGVIVASAPNFLFLKDTDGDDIADIVDTLMTGWGKRDTHAGPSNLQYGFDNKIYGVVGFSGFDGEINGNRVAFSQGLYRFNSNGTDFEFLASTSNNTWGLGMSEDNNIFISTANNTHSAYYSMPERLVTKFENNVIKTEINSVQKIDGHYGVRSLTPNLRQVDVVGGFTSAAGFQLYTARDFPEKYWNKIGFVTEPTVRLVHQALIEPDGAGFKEADGWNIMSGSDEWFGPIHAEVGPDGALWILDWYNFIIQHNVFVPRQAPSEKVLPFTEQPHGPGNAFDSDLRDKKHGRVYRVVYKESKQKSEQFKLSKSEPRTLIKALESTNLFWRMHAQRLLVERGEMDVVPDLLKLVSNQSVDKIGLNTAAIHSIWTLQGIGALRENEEVEESIMNALNHPSAGVRKAAVEALGKEERSIEKIVDSGIFSDENLNTRLSAFVVLAEMSPSALAIPVLEQAVKDKVNMDDAWLAAAINACFKTHFGFVDQNSSDIIVKEIANTFRNEIYRLGRRSRLQFSPNVANKNIEIEAEISRRDNLPFKGLILGEGTSHEGLVVFMEGNRLFWEVIQHGVRYSLSTTKGIGNQFKFKAVLHENRGLELYVNDHLVGNNPSVNLFHSSLDFYLRSGFDFNDEFALREFKDGSEFSGNMKGAEIKLSSVQELPRESMSNDQDNTVNEVPEEGSQTIIIRAVKDLIQFDKTHIALKAGSRITLIFENPDGMPHNLLIIRPGTLEVVGDAADAMLRSPDAEKLGYIPQIDEVLFFTPLVQSGEVASIEFIVPDEPGDYPFVCTFPGHWRGMNGIMEIR